MRRTNYFRKVREYTVVYSRSLAAFDLRVAQWADNSATARVGSGKSRRTGRVANFTHFHVYIVM